MPSSMAQARTVPFAAPLFAVVLHGLLRIGVCEAHPASTGLCFGLSLVVVTLRKRVPRVGRVRLRLYRFDAPNIAVRTRGETLSVRVDHPERLLLALESGSKGSALGGVQG